ncbi:prolipoprotein diacylglyceryl transferase family protein [Fulvivirga sediminis]|uniref:Prolipoprotein diacylglyceryl transferase n=1 Tax=Fulvivirga sediminis TaxID=2803949 RepID=A0A937JZZ5_9BACT|nr:prolipoprotein diacylglyceryl transferase family protein [Fulvivirga sediminis]MBL3657863.1 prolipoprotein diacylglyceryl transferase [Fulvivirga sediminis]
MSIPYHPTVAGHSINVHLITEYLAFFIAFRYYLYLRKRSYDAISSNNRLSIILGATIGALVGSRLIGFLENPLFDLSWKDIITLWNLKTIMGGLFGGLLGVELTKMIIGEKQRSGDLFTLPIILGIFIGRIGCFLSGTDEFTYGSETSFFTGMDLGDGIMRHPIALYELVFLIILFIIIKHIQDRKIYRSGMVFKIFMISYFGFRFMIEFIKPNLFFVLGLSSIQWLCIVCWAYYLPYNKVKSIGNSLHLKL